MYGKHFESMYEGSMYGAGVAAFAVLGYVIAFTYDSRVELNPRKLADTLGGTLEEIQGAIDFLCRPDPQSRNKEYEGRRLVKEGELSYFVPSWEFYQKIRNEDERREYNRVKQAEYRAKMAKRNAKKMAAKRKFLEECMVTPPFDQPAGKSHEQAVKDMRAEGPVMAPGQFESVKPQPEPDVPLKPGDHGTNPPILGPTEDSMGWSETIVGG